MASSRPNIPEGFLGAQPQFSELKLHNESHKEAEFRVKGDNNVVIKVNAKIPVKVVTKLTQYSTDKELPEFVFVQRKDKDSIHFHVAFPANGWYKFMIFALEESNSNESLPNVYNYLINVEGINMPAVKYPKAFTKFYKTNCYLLEPLVIDASSGNLDHVKFELIVPNAEKVSVHCVEEWFHLSKNGTRWEGTANLTKYSGKGNKVKVMANYDKDGSTYDALLEYSI